MRLGLVYLIMVAPACFAAAAEAGDITGKEKEGANIIIILVLIAAGIIGLILKKRDKLHNIAADCGGPKKYTVEWFGSEEQPIIKRFKAVNLRAAFDKAVAEHKNSSHPRVYVCGDGFSDSEEKFDNPHFGQAQNAESQVIDKPQSQRPVYDKEKKLGNPYHDQVQKSEPEVYLEHERVIYLERVRATSCYPVYRRVIEVLTTTAYIVTVTFFLYGVAAGFLGKDIDSKLTGVVTIVVCIFLFYVLIPLQKEVSLMFVDLVDSTLDRNSRS